MGFVSSLILIAVFGFLSHYWYRKYGLARGKLAWISYFTLIINFGFLLVDVFIYIGVFDFVFPILNDIPWVSIENGRDFMWNSFHLLGIDWDINFKTRALDWIGIIIFISYPIWFMFFKDFSRKIFGGNENRPYTRGISYLFTSPKKTKTREKGVKKPSLN
jgi:hypothetical protein